MSINTTKQLNEGGINYLIIVIREYITNLFSGPKYNGGTHQKQFMSSILEFIITRVCDILFFFFNGIIRIS
jgi:hypothetical protein